jgi:hypothetical protein
MTANSIRNTTNNLELDPAWIEITPAGLQMAEEFAWEQDSVTRRQQVFSNTLAVLAVANYLSQTLDIETHLPSSDFYDPLLRSLGNVADLVIPDVGSIECQPVLPGVDHIVLSETTGDRLAYVAVQLSEELYELKILGFWLDVPGRDRTAPIQLTELLPIADLPLCLAASMQQQEVLATLATQLRWMADSNFDDQLILPYVEAGIRSNLGEQLAAKQIALSTKNQHLSAEQLEEFRAVLIAEGDRLFRLIAQQWLSSLRQTWQQE